MERRRGKEGWSDRCGGGEAGAGKRRGLSQNQGKGEGKGSEKKKSETGLHSWEMRMVTMATAAKSHMMQRSERERKRERGSRACQQTTEEEKGEEVKAEGKTVKRWRGAEGGERAAGWETSQKCGARTKVRRRPEGPRDGQDTLERENLGPEITEKRRGRGGRTKRARERGSENRLLIANAGHVFFLSSIRSDR